MRCLYEEGILYHLVVEQVAKNDKDTKMSRKNVHRLERQPTSSEALANERA